MKRCPGCGETKPLDEFPRNRSTRNGYGAYCKPCHNLRNRETVKRLYGNSRHYHLRQRFGIGLDDFDRMVATQDGLCAICRKKPAVQVDHDHATRRLRAILCDGCNGGLSAFYEREDLLLKAIEYLEKWS
ncbi:MAG: endonuclease domain-containing protein [Actinomycetota bacterium]